MPAPLLALANELLLSIADYLDSERSINAAARTNRRLYLLLNDYLYRHNVVESESSALCWAARSGQSGSMAKAIAHAGNVNAQWNSFPKSRWFGYLVSFDGEARIIDLLRQNRCSYCTPIYLAILGGHEEVADLLIENGADIESRLGPWAHPLQAAAKYGQLLVAQRLSAQGINIDKPAPYSGRTALHIACLSGNDMIVQCLIDAGANIMARDDELDTPLHLALEGCEASQSPNGCLKTVQWLLVSGADMHARNRKGRTPIGMAIHIKGSDIGCLFKKGSKIAVYEAGVQDHQLGCRSTSLQRLWTAYVDKQTEASVEAIRAKGIATIRAESTNQKLQVQQKQEARRRSAVAQQQAEERSREERAKALRKQEEDQQEIEPSFTQKQDVLRRTWLELRANAECVDQAMQSGASGRLADCKHAALSWQRKKGRVECAFCKEGFAKCFFFQCPDCGTNVCQSCTRRYKIPS